MEKIKVNGYLYETHMHTSEGSACASNTGAEMARAYAQAGYTGIIITDHFVYGNTAVDRSLPWSEWVEKFCLGYEHAKEEGEKCGLQVFFGWESGYGGPEFLVYGLDKQWLLNHPEIKDATVEEQLQLVHAGGQGGAPEKLCPPASVMCSAAKACFPARKALPAQRHG